MNNYEIFLQLHHQSEPFIIANAWNVKSAKLLEENGYKAIATSSGAIANSLGYEDGEKIPFSELLYMVHRIRSCTSIPLSVDFEKGYTNDLTELNDNIQKLIDTGVVGINLEDSQGEEQYLKKLSSIKNYLVKTNQQLFINARTDGFLQKLDSPLEKNLTKAKLYKEAGADGLFVTGVQDPVIINNELFHEISQPVLRTKAEIYQYIGDEVVLTWEMKDGLENSNCLRAFFMFQENLIDNRENYFRKFGVHPEFKAGLHFGKVVSAQIGDLKREIVYNGDVLNTTARIQNECNKYQRNFLVSGILRTRLQQINGFRWEKVDVVKLRGKEMEVELFSVSNADSQ